MIYDRDCYTDYNKYSERRLEVECYEFDSTYGTYSFNEDTQKFTETVGGDYSIASDSPLLIYSQDSEEVFDVSFETIEITLAPDIDFSIDSVTISVKESLRKMAISITPDFIASSSDNVIVKNLTSINNPDWALTPSNTSVRFIANAKRSIAQFKLNSKTSCGMRVKVRLHQEGIFDSFEILAITVSAPSNMQSGGRHG